MVEYQGHRVGRGTISPNDTMVKDMVDLRALRTRRAVRKFLGLLSFRASLV